MLRSSAFQSDAVRGYCVVIVVILSLLRVILTLLWMADPGVAGVLR